MKRDLQIRKSISQLRVSKTGPRDKDGIEIPVPLSEKLYEWFSGRR